MAFPFRTACGAGGAANRIGRGRPAAEAMYGACRARLFTGTPAEVDEQEFERHLRNSDIPVRQESVKQCQVASRDDGIEFDKQRLPRSGTGAGETVPAGT